MTDDVTLPGTGVKVAGDNISGVLYQRVKISQGDDGSASDTSATNPLPITITAADLAALTDKLESLLTELQLKADLTETQPVSGSVSVTGTVTANTGLSQPLTDTQLRATAVPVSGTFWPETQPVSGSVTVSSGSVSVSSGSVTMTSGSLTGAIPAGENHIGEVGGKTILTAITFSLDTNIYADGDVLADTQILTACLRVNDGTGVIQDAIFNDEDDQGQPFDVIVLNANTSLGTENSAPNISDANARNIVGRFSVVSGDWYDLGGVRIANIKNIGIAVKGATGADDIYIALISRGTGTYSASGITAIFKILCD